MQVHLDKVFSIEAPSEVCWRFLKDISGVAACMPGSEITKTIDENHYEGKTKVRIGPATMAFNGDIEIKEIDADKRMLHLVGKGQDTKGSSSAEMDLVATVIDADDGKCELHGKACVTVIGKAASLGGRMMNQVADQILNQFGENFIHRVIATTGESGAAEEAKARLAEQPNEINGLTFVWAMIAGFFKSLFGKGPTGPG